MRSIGRYVIPLVTSVTVTFAGPAQASMVDVIQTLRTVGCAPANRLAPRTPLHRNRQLDAAAQAMAHGQGLQSAVAHSGYEANMTSALHVAGSERAAAKALAQSSCHTLINPDLRDLGFFQRGADSWFVLAAPYLTLAPAQASQVAARTLRLVNALRARPQRCGTHAFAPAPALRAASVLNQVALLHAEDMAQHNYFDHRDRAGGSPADRVRAAGYHESLVGENIAYGPNTPDEVVQGWLQSPGHCENLMTAQFAEMGIAFAAGHDREHFGLYWVQVLAKMSR